MIKGERSDRNHRQPLGDYVDRMHWDVTVCILCVFALLVGSKQHFGNPIDCFISAEIDKVRSWQKYILGYCFTQGTYRYHFGLNVTKPKLYVRDQFDAKYISVKYYQWVPFFFAFQLLCFMMPDLFWIYMQSCLYIDMSMIVTESSELNMERCSSDRSSKLNRVADYIFSYFYYRGNARRGFMPSLFRLPSIATASYIIAKFLYLLNALLQLYLITFFLGFPNMHWGLKIMFSLLKQQFFPCGIAGPLEFNDRMSHFPYFPLEVGCNYTKMETSNNLHTSSIQCIIPLNYINEKLFLFLWFWIVILILITSVNIVMFIGSIMNKSRRQEAILSILKEKNDDDFMNNKRGTAHRFIDSFLGADGVLLMRFITAKAGPLTCRDVLQEVWLKYYKERGTVLKVTENDEDWNMQYSENCSSGSYYTDGSSVRIGLNSNW